MTRYRKAGALLLALGIIAAACGDDDDDNGAAATTAPAATEAPATQAPATEAPASSATGESSATAEASGSASAPAGANQWGGTLADGDYGETYNPSQKTIDTGMISRPVVELGDDGTTARARTDVVWIAANFENTILGRYEDELVHDGEGWKFKRRVEHPVQYIPGPPPMSDDATGVSGATMRVDESSAVES